MDSYADFKGSLIEEVEGGTMFFKRKAKIADEVIEEVVVDRESVEKEIELLSKKIELEASAENYSSIASLYQSIDCVDEAIQYYEKSLESDKKLGKSYNELTRLYNIKRKEAAKNKDDKEIQFYMNKLDSLLQLSKDVIRGKV